MTPRVQRFGIIGLLLAMVVAAGAAHADSIQLRRSASVGAKAVRLAEVATLEGDAALALANVVVIEAGQQTSLSQEQLRKRLAAAGVNWAKMSLKGFETCEISRNMDEIGAPNDAEVPGAEIDAPPAPIVSNPTEVIGVGAASTIGQQLTDWLRRMHGDRGAALQITFADRDRKELDGGSGQDQLVFTSAAAGNLGRVPITVQRFRGEKLIGTQRYLVEVTVQRLAVVAARPIERGAVVTGGDVEIRQVVVDRDSLQVLDRLDDVIGQTAVAAIREGAVITGEAVRSALLVKRNDRIRVQAIAGGLVIQMFARALEDGADGQLIQARNEVSRESFAVRVIGPRQAMIITDAGDPAGRGAVANGEKHLQNKAKQ